MIHDAPKLSVIFSIILSGQDTDRPPHLDTKSPTFTWKMATDQTQFSSVSTATANSSSWF